MSLLGLAVLGSTFLVGLVLFHVLERVAPVLPAAARGPRRRGYLADLTAMLVNGPALSALTKIGAYQVVVLIPPAHALLSAWSWPAQLALFVLVNDFARYWLHRAYHASDLLWRIHRVHHTVVDMDALSTFRVHLLEAVIKYGVIILPFHVLGIDKWVIVTYTCVDLLKGFWHHANLRTYIGRWNYLLNSAELHWWHHSVEARGQRANYGSIFSLWDWLFRTAYWPRGAWPDRIGVDGFSAFPETYLGQLASVRHTDAQWCSENPPGHAPPQHVAGADPAPLCAPEDAQVPAAPVRNTPAPVTAA